MIRTLLVVAGVALVAAVACFAAVGALGPIHWGSWTWSSEQFGHGSQVEGDGPTVSRELTWTGGQALRVMIPADITYTQGAVAKVVVTGPQRAVESVALKGERLLFDRRVRDPGRLQVVMTAPGVREFHLAGAQNLRVRNYDQDRFELHAAGASQVAADGKVGDLVVHMAGAGDIDLGGLKARRATVHMAGAGRTVIAASDRAVIHAAGAGEVRLASEPRELETHMVGATRLLHGPAAVPEAPAAPLPPAQPSKTRFSAA